MRSLASVVVAIAVAAGAAVGVAAQSVPVPEIQASLGGRTLADAQRLFYNARYEEAATLTLALRSLDADDLGAYELRTSALHFQVKRALGDAGDRDKALKQCAACPALMEAFLSDTTRGRSLARERLKATPLDEEALFFLGKINLNYVWLQLGTLGRRTGWDEYWEARRSLDAVLKRNPIHVRARVARAWIDYIVDTKMPWGTGWLLGGGNKKKALAALREAADADADEFVRAEADFALWDLHVRERQITEAVPVARGLARDFPDNPEIARFLDTHDPDRPR